MITHFRQKVSKVAGVSRVGPSRPSRLHITTYISVVLDTSTATVPQYSAACSRRVPRWVPEPRICLALDRPCCTAEPVRHAPTAASYEPATGAGAAPNPAYRMRAQVVELIRGFRHELNIYVIKCCMSVGLSAGHVTHNLASIFKIRNVLIFPIRALV